MASVALGSFAIVLSEFLPIGLFAAIAAPAVTVVTSGLDRRVVLVGLSLLLVVTDGLAALAPSLPILLLARVLLGVSLGGFWAIGAGIAGRLVPAADTIRATSLITAGISVATVVSLPLSAAVSALTSWRVAFVIGGVVGLLALGVRLVALSGRPLRSTARRRSVVLDNGRSGQKSS